MTNIAQSQFETPAEALRELQIVLPKDFILTPELMYKLLSNLSYTRFPLSFEVIGNKEKIVIQFCVYDNDVQALSEQLQAYVPEVNLVDHTDYLKRLWLRGMPQTAIDFGLEHESMLPLQTVSNYKLDPLIGITAAMSSLENYDVGLLQVLFQPIRNNWTRELMNSVTDWDGTAFFADAPQMLPLTKEKISSPLYAACIRVAAQSSSGNSAWKIAKNIGATLSQFSSPPSNSLMPLINDDYEDEGYIERIITRQSHRTGMLLNADELVSVVHVPDASVRTQKVVRVSKRTKAAPSLAKNHDLVLGLNEHRNESITVSLTSEQRLRHMYLIGASGTGKSTMMLNMVIQDMQAGNGVAVLDPHGDLIDTILGFVPDDRMEDVIVFDPSDEQYPIGFNIVDAHSELEKTLLASDLTSVFKRLSTSWGDQMNSVLANGIAAMLESTQGGTLPILRRFLVDKKFRTEFLATVQDPENVFYWEREFPLLSGKPQGPVLTRLDTFLRPKPIRYMVAQKENKIDFGKIMQNKKIFLAKLSQGAIGVENSYLMGAFLVTKFNQIAFSRQELSKDQRTNFHLYVDEFHNFITPSMESILSGSRKYNLALTIANQNLRQLEGRDADVSESVISNPYTRVCFRLGDLDAKRLQSGFSFFEAQDLQSLGIGKAIARVERAEYDFNLTTTILPETNQKESKEKSRAIVKYSQQKYGTRREEVEDLINESLGKSQKSKIPRSAKTDIHPAPEKLEGRGGAEHKRLQKYIKDIAEENGFKAMIEKRINNGAGHVDVVLERDGLSIACEIAVNSTVEQEIHNIQKCVDEGFDTVLSVFLDEKLLKKTKDIVLSKNSSFYEHSIDFLTPDLILNYISKVRLKNQQTNHLGYEVTVDYLKRSTKQQRKMMQQIEGVISNNGN